MNNSPTNTNAPIGIDLLSISDTLVGAKDFVSLGALRDVITHLILIGITDDEVSLVEVTECIDEAVDLLNDGKSPDEARSSSIRRLLGREE